MLPAKGANGETVYSPHVGGAVFNTARALGHLGAKVGILSGVSVDEFGGMLVQALEDSGVDTSVLIRSDRLTTLAVVTLKDGQATYGFYDEGSAGRMITPADLPAIPDKVSALFFGGISLVGNPAADSYVHLLKAMGADRPVMLDPNIRPSFITDEPAYRSRLSGMINRSDILKVSDEDLHWLIGSSDPTEFFTDTSLSIILLTRGSDGVTLFTRRERQNVGARQVEVVDTVGAGDAFNAGFLSRLETEGMLSKSALSKATADQLRPAVEKGNDVAAIVVSRAGASPPRAGELS